MQLKKNRFESKHFQTAIKKCLIGSKTNVTNDVIMQILKNQI